MSSSLSWVQTLLPWLTSMAAWGRATRRCTGQVSWCLCYDTTCSRPGASWRWPGVVPRRLAGGYDSRRSGGKFRCSTSPHGSKKQILFDKYDEETSCAKDHQRIRRGRAKKIQLCHNTPFHGEKQSSSMPKTRICWMASNAGSFFHITSSLWISLIVKPHTLQSRHHPLQLHDEGGGGWSRYNPCPQWRHGCVRSAYLLDIKDGDHHQNPENHWRKSTVLSQPLEPPPLKAQGSFSDVAMKNSRPMWTTRKKLKISQTLVEVWKASPSRRPSQHRQLLTKCSWMLWAATASQRACNTTRCSCKSARFSCRLLQVRGMGCLL